MVFPITRLPKMLVAKICCRGSNTLPRFKLLFSARGAIHQRRMRVQKVAALASMMDCERKLGRDCCRCKGALGVEKADMFRQLSPDLQLGPCAKLSI